MTRITAAKCSIQYKAEDGFRSEMTTGSMREGQDNPLLVLTDVVREASRLLAMCGNKKMAQDAAKEGIRAAQSAAAHKGE